MIAVDGVVIPGGEIRLKTGACVKCPRPMRVGEEVKVGWDLITDGPGMVMKIEDMNECWEIDPPEYEKEEIIDYEPELYDDFDDY